MKYQLATINRSWDSTLAKNLLRTDGRTDRWIIRMLYAPGRPRAHKNQRLVGWLCWGLTSQSTIFQSYRDGAIASWVINQYFRGVKCLAQGHNTAAVGLEPRTSRSGVRHSTTEPPRSPPKKKKKKKKKKSKESINNASINVFPQSGVGGNTLGIRLPKQSLPSEIWQTTLAQGCFIEKISKKLCLILEHVQGTFDTKLCHMGRELDPNCFPNCLIPWGNTALPHSGGKHWEVHNFYEKKWATGWEKGPHDKFWKFENHVYLKNSIRVEQFLKISMLYHKR